MQDCLLHDGLTDAYNDIHMVNTLLLCKTLNSRLGPCYIELRILLVDDKQNPFCLFFSLIVILV